MMFTLPLLLSDCVVFAGDTPSVVLTVMLHLLHEFGDFHVGAYVGVQDPWFAPPAGAACGRWW